VFPQQPVVRVQGPLLLCQLVETPLLNIVNFQTLIATKAARICQAARGEPVLEFGLRRDQRGHELLGIRLDSGDLAYQSIEARRLLEAAGFPKAAIVASNDLNEGIIDSLKGQGAAIAVWGVRTKLVTAYNQPFLGEVYKLAEVRRPGEDWRYKVKLSEQEIKTSIPGVLQIRRFRTNDLFKADMIYDLRLGAPQQSPTIIDPIDPEHRIEMRADAE
jgi:nicotinate phosphoribosyltransferase